MRRFIRFTIVLCAILALFPLYTRLKVTAAPVPPGVHLGGLELSALKDKKEIRHHLEGVYAQTIVVRYAKQQLALRPIDVDFHIDVDQMVAEASRYLEGSSFLDIAVRHAFGFPQQRREIPVRFTLNTAILRSWLAAVALEHDRAPGSARLLPAQPQWSDGTVVGPGAPAGYVGQYLRDWTWRPGAPGYTLDIEQSIPQVITALTSNGDRVADLVVNELSAPVPSMADLERAIDSHLANFPGFGAVYVMDLQTGDTAHVDDEVAFSGMSTLKIFIAAAVMHRLDNGVMAGDENVGLVGQWIDYALGESNNYAANQLLRFLGNGETGAGARAVTEFANSLGFVNTYMQSGFDEAPRTQIATPGNQRTDWNTDPDPNLQTTPAEMGRMLAAIYDCSQGKGLLIETYPGEITETECKQILFYMSHDQFQELVWGGLPRPQQAWIVHKHGFAYEAHSDAALIWGPAGPYVISIFLFRNGWMDWATSNSTMKAISRLTWNYFAFQQSQSTPPVSSPGRGGAEVRVAPILAPPPGYVKISEHVPTAASGGQ
jgi:beta-lactamase class A